MRVGCNLLWLVPGRVGGTETATVSMLRQMAKEPPADVELTLYAIEPFGQSYPDVVEAFPTRLAPLTGRIRPLRVAAENSWLARRSREGLDLVHHMGGVLPVVRSVPGLVTIHDLQPFDMPENFEASKRAFLHWSIPRSVRRAAGVIVPSEYVRRGVVERFDAPPERVHLAPWGVDPPSSEVSVAQVQARYGLPRRWFTYPSFTWNHKNHAMLLRAFAALVASEHDVMLVLTGGEGPAEQEVVDEITRLGLRSRVRRTGLIPRRDVMAIVRGAVAMVFPSRYEGFGLPVLEGMSVGTPVLASDAGALPEVAGDAACVLPVDEPEAWTAAMSRMLEDGAERQRLAAAGRARAASFTWSHTADRVFAAYRAVGRDAAAPAVPPAPTEDAAPAAAPEPTAPAAGDGGGPAGTPAADAGGAAGTPAADGRSRDDRDDGVAS